MNDPAQDNQPSGDQLVETAPPTPNDQQSDTAQPDRKFKLTWKFTVGFLGWYLVMALIYGIMFRNTDTGSEGLMICGGLLFPLQVLALILLFLIKKTTRYWMGNAICARG